MVDLVWCHLAACPAYNIKFHGHLHHRVLHISLENARLNKELKSEKTMPLLRLHWGNRGLMLCGSSVSAAPLTSPVSVNKLIGEASTYSKKEKKRVNVEHRTLWLSPQWTLGDTEAEQTSG